MAKIRTSDGLNDFDFEFDEEEGSITIDGYSGESEQVIVPASVGAIPVTDIGNLAFLSCPEITNVIIPEGIRSIGWSAFSKCTGLTSISLPESLVSIGSSAFEDCKKLMSITLPKRIAEIEWNVFEGCDNLAEIILDKGNEAYTSNDGILFDKNMTTLIRYPQQKKGDYTVPGTVIAINHDAFNGCNELTRITVPQDTMFINYHTFLGCKHLTDITVNENNLTYSSIDGVLFNKEKETLLFYPRGKANKDYIVPEGIRRIENSAFCECESLVSITLPKSLKVIDACAFKGCKGLASITLPKDLMYIGESAFEGCTLLKSITLSRKTKTMYKTFEGFSGQLVYLD